MKRILHAEFGSRHAQRHRPQRLAMVKSADDIAIAREEGRRLAAAIGFSPRDCQLVATAIAELASNIVRYAEHGEIAIDVTETAAGRGITVTASDDGPGIRHPALAVRDGYSTSGGLGLGLPGVRRLMDDFRLETDAHRGTTVTVTKWVPRAS